MSVRIRIAETAGEIDGVFRLRHQVFVEEMRYFPRTKDGRLYDRFDALPIARNLVAMADDRIVGGVRVVEASELGFPGEELFDFSPYLPPPPARLGFGSMLVVVPEYRCVPRLTFALMGMSFCLARRCGLTHLAAVAAPSAERIFLKAGFRVLTPRHVHKETGLTVIPMLLALDELSVEFCAFVDSVIATTELDLVRNKRPGKAFSRA